MFSRFRFGFWIPLSFVLIPSTILHIRLLVLIWKYRHKDSFNSPFYRLFYVQGIIELTLLYVYHASRMIVRDRIFGDDFLIATNDNGVFSQLYYIGTIYYFHHVQVWGVIVQSFVRCVAVCSPNSRVERWHEANPSALWAMINLAVPCIVVSRLLFQEDSYFEENEQGRAILCSPPEVLQANATQANIFSVVGSVISAICYVLVLRKLLEMRRLSCIRKYRQERQLTFIGLMLFLSLCSMTIFYLIVTLAAVYNPDLVHSVRPFYIVPVMFLTFVNPWMLVIANGKLRGRYSTWSSTYLRY